MRQGACVRKAVKCGVEAIREDLGLGGCSFQGPTGPGKSVRGATFVPWCQTEGWKQGSKEKWKERALAFGIRGVLARFCAQCFWIFFRADLHWVVMGRGSLITHTNTGRKCAEW